MLPSFQKEQFPLGVALFLDIDGTLLEIRDRPKLVKVNDSLKKLLFNLEQRLGGAIAFISGRTILDVDQLFKPLKLPTSGKHGAERRDQSGQVHIIECNTSKITSNIIKTLQKFVNQEIRK